jgi:hypothetical protein
VSVADAEREHGDVHVHGQVSAVGTQPARYPPAAGRRDRRG